MPSSSRLMTLERASYRGSWRKPLCADFKDGFQWIQQRASRGRIDDVRCCLQDFAGDASAALEEFGDDARPPVDEVRAVALCRWAAVNADASSTNPAMDGARWAAKVGLCIPFEPACPKSPLFEPQNARKGPWKPATAVVRPGTHISGGSASSAVLGHLGRWWRFRSATNAAG